MTVLHFLWVAVAAQRLHSVRDVLLPAAQSQFPLHDLNGSRFDAQQKCIFSFLLRHCDKQYIRGCCWSPDQLLNSVSSPQCLGRRGWHSTQAEQMPCNRRGYTFWSFDFSNRLSSIVAATRSAPTGFCCRRKKKPNPFNHPAFSFGCPQGWRLIFGDESLRSHEASCSGHVGGFI